MNILASHHTRRATLWAVYRIGRFAVALFSAVLARPIEAQDTATIARPIPTTKPTRTTCYRGQPLPVCQRFVLTELGFLRTVTTTGRAAPGDAGTVRERDYDGEVLLELGMMQNRGAKHAIGAVLVLQPDIGAKFRYRRWLDSSAAALDLSAGVVRERRYPSQGAALVSDVAFNVGDYGAILLRGSASHRDGRVATGLHAGARLGSKPALISGATMAAVLGVVLALAGGTDW